MQIKTKIVSGHTTDSKPVKQEVNGTVILPPLVFPAETLPRGKRFGLLAGSVSDEEDEVKVLKG